MSVIVIDVAIPAKIESLLQFKKEWNAQFFMFHLFHPRFRRKNNQLDNDDSREGPLTRSDMQLSFSHWNNSFIGKMSPWIDVDCSHHSLRTASEKVFFEELEWALHLNLKVTVLPSMNGNVFTNYARCIMKFIENGSSNRNMQLWIPVESLSVSLGDSKEDDGWSRWNKLKSQLPTNFQIKVILKLDQESALYYHSHEKHVKRWIAEPLKAVVLPTTLFVMNNENYPVLLKPLQELIRMFLYYSIGIVVNGKSYHQSKSLLPYTQYIHFLKHQVEQTLTMEESFSRSFWDILQCPLQPLADNLESQTYEIFEQDPVKYVSYEKAIMRGFIYLLQQHSAQIPKTFGTKLNPVVAMIVGAGRGPLVAAAISAAHKMNINVKIYAIEKNPHAIVALRNRLKTENWTNVKIVREDMRTWKPTELGDMLISELLGSFGDNELSPECLDSAQLMLKDGGISIPQKYSSYISPVSCHSLWLSAKMNQSNDKGLEIPYVVRLHRHWALCDPEKCWEFQHPNSNSTMEDNTRYACLKFDVSTAATIHGFSGYFDTQLFGEESLSIVPATYSKDMFSWFPIFFPLTTPLLIREGEKVVFHIWRCRDKQKAWYEWCVSSPTPTPVQNIGGKAYSIYL